MKCNACLHAHAMALIVIVSSYMQLCLGQMSQAIVLCRTHCSGLILVDNIWAQAQAGHSQGEPNLMCE